MVGLEKDIADLRYGCWLLMSNAGKIVFIDWIFRYTDMDQYENLIILKDGQICTTLIQQKDTTRYQSAFYDQYTFA